MLCPQGALPRHQVPQLRTVISQGLLLNYSSTETLRLVSSGRGRETRSREVVIEMQMTEPVAHPINSVANRKWKWGHKRKAGLQPPSGLPDSALATLHNPQATGRQVPAWLPEGGALPESSAHACPPQRCPPPRLRARSGPGAGAKLRSPGSSPLLRSPGGGSGARGATRRRGGRHSPEGGPLPVSCDLHQTPTGLSAQFSPEPHAVCLPHRPSPHLLQPLVPRLPRPLPGP